MKRVCFLVLLALLTPGKLYAFDVLGLQPVGPEGVFSTFSTDSVVKNKWAVEIAAEKSREPTFTRLDLRTVYGLTDSLEFNMTVPYVYHLDDRTDGMEDVALGFKHRFYDEGKYGPSLAYLINASVPSGRDELSTGGRFGAGFLVSKRVGPFVGNFNFFYERPGKGSLQNEISFLNGIEFAASRSFTLLAEVIVQKSHFSDHYDHVETRFGYRLKTTESLYTTLGVGSDFKRRTPEYRVLLSFSYIPLRERKIIKRIFEEE